MVALGNFIAMPDAMNNVENPQIMVKYYIGFLILIGLERLVELVISRRNAKWVIENGGFEVGKEHFKYMTVLHTGFLIACGLEALLLRASENKDRSLE